MASREELEKLVCGDKVLIGGVEKVFIGLKPEDIRSRHPVICLQSAGRPDAWALDTVHIIKPKKKLYAYVATKNCENGTYIETEVMWLTVELHGLVNRYRAPEWDREQV